MKSTERILVTGGCGFIGHHLVLALKALGADVLIVDNFDHEITNPLYQKFIDDRLRLITETTYPILRGDTKDFSLIRETIDQFRPDRIVHLAAIPSAVLCNENPAEGFDNNLTATKNLLEAVRTARVELKQFVYFSSSMVYGHFRTESVTEESPTDPIGIYGVAKLSSELLLKAYNHVFGVPFTIVRPSALYGPRCINRRITQVFVENALQGKPVFVEGDGSDRLDFTHVDDVVDGVVLILTKPDALNQTFNITFGDGRSIIDLCVILQRYFPDLRIEYKPVDRLKPKRGTLDILKARTVLGFNPRRFLETGYSEYIQWYQNNGVYDAFVKK